MRRPPSGNWWQKVTPGQAFAWFVTWCGLGIIATVVMMLFFPWSIPVWLGAVIAIGYFATRELSRLIGP